MSKITKEVKIGIAFLVALFLLYFGINFLKGINLFKPTNTYVVVFDDVAGMLQSDPITVNGLKIGQVHGMKLHPTNPKKVLVDIQMDKGVQIPKLSKISLDASMLGSSTLLLEYDGVEGGFFSPGDTIVGSRKSGMMDVVATMVPKVELLLPKLDSILTGINHLANDPALKNTLANAEMMTADFVRISKNIDKLMVTVNNDFPRISKSLGNTASNFENMSAKFNGIDLASTFNKLDSTMTNVQYMSSKLVAKDNSLGLLLNDREMYDSLNTTIGNASLLLEDMKKNPSKYINVKVF